MSGPEPAPLPAAGPDEARDEDAGPPQAAAPRAGRRAAVREVAVLGLVALALALLVKLLLVQTFYIPSGSMLQTLQLDDRVVVEKVTYRFREPQRGETIVFHDPNAVAQPGFSGTGRSVLTELGLPGGHMDLIKRIIGLPGETVEIVGGVVLVDGTALDEPYALTDGRDHGPVTVPQGHYFLLGDNRGSSDDSRFGLGMVPASEIVGRTLAVVWPLRNATTDLDHDYARAGEGGGQAAARAERPPTS